VVIFLLIAPPNIIYISPAISRRHYEDDVTFRCIAVGFPLPSITWTSDSPSNLYYPPGYLDHYANETVEDDQVISELYIYPVILPDRGTYTCHANNNHGEDTATVELIVIGERLLLLGM